MKINELQKRLIEERNSIFEAQTNIKFNTSGMKEAMVKINNIQNDTASIEKEEGVLKKKIPAFCQTRPLHHSQPTNFSTHP